jgi:phospho-N-acetylmuramoyl-pentapeptide-transferase
MNFFLPFFYNVTATDGIIKILIFTVISFTIALICAPHLIRLLRWLRFWKKSSRSVNMSGTAYQDQTLQKFYSHDESNLKVPRGGGLLIWITSLAIATAFWILLKIDPNNPAFRYLNFVDRKSTFIPMGTMFFGAVLGFIDDALATLETGGNYLAGGLKLTQRAGAVALFSAAVGSWFYVQNGDVINKLSFFGQQFMFNNIFGLNAPWIIIPITIFLSLLLWGSSVIDGFDGLTGSVMVPIFFTMAGIAYVKGFPQIAVFMAVIGGTIMAFLWFNISPAKFYMGDTGSTPLLLTLAVVSIIIDVVYLIPFFGIMLLATVGGNIIQITSKKLFKRKVFKAAPIHHHFEALGLKRDQVVFRYSVITIAMCTLSIAITLLNLKH